MLEFLYRGDYDDDVDPLHPLEYNANMYGLAEEFRIYNLKDLSVHKFLVALNGPVISTDLLGPFLKATEVIYSTTPSSDRGLRDQVMTVLQANKVALKNHDGFMALTESGIGNGTFAGDVIRAFM